MSAITRRQFLRASATVGALTLAGCVPPTQPTSPAPESSSDATPSAPTLPSTSPSVPASRFGESPALAALVEAGQLPPVEERIPSNPALYPVEEMIGKYGGTIRRAHTGMSDSTGPSKVQNASLSRFSTDLTLRPDLCESWEVSDDATSYTITLRKGTRWSDGEPFDTSSVGWWYDNVVMNPDLTRVPPQRWSCGSPVATGELRILDDVTFVVTFQSPFPLFMDGQNRDQPFAPGHYLAQFHAELTPDRAALDKTVADRQLAEWTDLFAEMNTWYNNPDRPTVGPWKAENKLSEELFIMKRNPYFWGVDREGNQLPYVDQVNHRLFSTPDVLNLWIVNGEIDFQWRHLSIGNYTLFRENEASGQYELKLWKTDKGETLTINHDSQDPRLAEFFQNRDVRIAMNLAMNRDEINELVYDGLMTPRQASPNSMSPEYHEGAATAYAYYAPDEANAHLDQAGYAERDAEGYRLWKDGSGEPISFIIEGFRVEGSPEVDAVLMVSKYLEEVGIKATYKSEERALYEERRQANLVDAAWYTVGHFALVMLVHHNYYVGQLVDRPWAGGWGLWVLDNDDPNGNPPPDGHFLWRMWEIWDQALVEPDPQKRIDLNLQILDIWAEEVPVVGVVGEAPGPTVVKNGLRNCSGIYMITDATCDESLIGMPTLFWDDPEAHV